MQKPSVAESIQRRAGKDCQMLNGDDVGLVRLPQSKHNVHSANSQSNNKCQQTSKVKLK